MQLCLEASLMLSSGGRSRWVVYRCWKTPRTWKGFDPAHVTSIKLSRGWTWKGPLVRMSALSLWKRTWRGPHWHRSLSKVGWHLPTRNRLPTDSVIITQHKQCSNVGKLSLGWIDTPSAHAVAWGKFDTLSETHKIVNFFLCFQTPPRTGAMMYRAGKTVNRLSSRVSRKVRLDKLLFWKAGQVVQSGVNRLISEGEGQCRDFSMPAAAIAKCFKLAREIRSNSSQVTL